MGLSISQFSKDLIHHILLYLGRENILTYSLVCNKWYEDARSETFWQALFYRDCNATCSPRLADRKYFYAYKNYWASHSNLAKGIYTKKTIKSHHKKVTCLAVFQRALYSGSKDGTIKSWDWMTRELKKTFISTCGPVSCLIASRENLYSGCYRESAIEIWDGEKEKPLDVLKGNGRGIHSLAIDQQKLYSASDERIEVWDLNTKQHLQTLTHHRENLCLAIDGRNLYSSGATTNFKTWSCFSDSDPAIKVWDLNTSKCIDRITWDKKTITSLTIGEENLYVGHKKAGSKVLHIPGGLPMTPLSHQGIVKCQLFANGKLITGSQQAEKSKRGTGGTLRVWNLKLGTCFNLAPNHTKTVTALLFVYGNLFSAAGNTITVWDFTKK